jgi:DNA-binding NarL/FixJ family response regulator
LLAWMRAHAEFRLIPVLVLTSSSDQADIRQAFELGAQGYMIKPVQFGELEKMTRTIVEYWRASCVP